MLELRERDGLSRICRLRTRSNTIDTPALLPVINPNLLLIEPGEMVEEFGIQALITNSYIIRKNDDLRERALGQGLHEMLGFDGTIMTDSGTFQSHIYGEVPLDPMEIVEFQKNIGSDIGTILDIFTEPEDGHTKAGKDLEVTLERARASVELKGEMMLAGTIQGGVFRDLRQRSATETSSLDIDLFPIGGVVPLMEKQRYSTLVDVVMSSKKGLDPGRPVHLFGCGHPLIFSLASLMGCDLFDSAAYAKFAKTGRMMFPDGTRFLDNMDVLPCECPVCSSHTAAELRSSPDKEKKLARHNLHASFAELRRVKQAIHEGQIWEYTETRCRSHPSLMEAFRTLARYRDDLERYEPLSRQLAFLHNSELSYSRPLVSRFRKRLVERYSQPDREIYVIFPESNKPYYRTHRDNIRKALEMGESHFWVDSYFGPVPIELDEAYPIAQSVIPNRLEDGVLEQKEHYLKEMAEEYFRGQGIYWEGRETLENIQFLSGKPGKMDLDMMRIRAVADLQFGKGASDVLFKGDVILKKSRKTGKIRNVMADGEHILSMRAGDGFFTLKEGGAVRLHGGFPSPRLRVVVDTETTEFNREGKNVFAKFILDADPDLIPGDEVLVVDEADKLVAIGRTIMVRDELLAFNSGVGIKVRQGFPE